jgi:hypothetical protein
MSANADEQPIAGTMTEPGFINETPEDIEDFLAAHGIKKCSYICTVKRFPPSGGSVAEWLPCSTKNEYPEIEDIGKRFGPGKYLFCFTWNAQDPQTGKNKRTMKEYKIVLGEEWNDLNDEYMAEKWIEKKKKIANMKTRAEMEAALEGKSINSKTNDTDPKTAGLDYLREAKAAFTDLGLPVGGSAGAVVAAEGQGRMYELMLAMNQKSSENMMTMMAQMNQNMMALVTALITNNKPQSSDGIMKEVINMVSQTINLKEVLNPEKKGVIDRVFELMESVMPSIVALAAKPKAERIQSPLYQMAANSDEMNQIKKDPEMLKEMVKKWDEAHGTEQTDIILGTVGLRRPSAHPAQTTAPEETVYEEVEEDPAANPLTDESGQAGAE